jgi:hypothetical protein
MCREGEDAAAKVDFGVVLYQHRWRDRATSAFLAQRVFESLAVKLRAQS